MARYQVATIAYPQGWKPAGPDDVPSDPGDIGEALFESDDLFAAVARACDDNVRAAEGGRWAVVVEPGTMGMTWRNARLCTPLAYKVASVWWPSGWEPKSPVDVPNCVWRARERLDDARLAYPQALAAVRGLNQQSIDHAGDAWYVVLAVENEPLAQTVSYEPSGVETTVQTRRLHVVRSSEGEARGDCSHCPAHGFDCAQADWTSLEQTMATGVRRPLARGRGE